MTEPTHGATQSPLPPQPGSHVPAHDASRGALESEDGRSIGELLTAVTTNVSTLMQQEVALAKAELRQTTSRASKGVGMFAGAGAGGLLFLVFLSVSATWGLSRWFGVAWSALIVAVIWAIVAAVLASMGKKEMERVRGLDRTTETLGKVPNALKGKEEENR